MERCFILGAHGLEELHSRPDLRRGTVLVYHYYAGNTQSAVLLDNETGKAAITDYLDEWKAGQKDIIAEAFSHTKGEYDYGGVAYLTLDKMARHIKDHFGIGVYYTDQVLPEEDVKAAEELAQFITKCYEEAGEREKREWEEKKAELRKEWGGILTENPQSDKDVTDNIRKWLKVKYPGCKFSVRKEHSGCVNITGIDGPSLDDLKASCDIWMTGHSDPSGDYWDNTNSAFNELYGGFSFLFTYREFSDATRENLREMVMRDFPTLPDVTDEWCRGAGMSVTENMNLYVSICDKYGIERDWNTERMYVNSIVSELKYCYPVMPEIKPKEGNKGNGGKDVHSAPIGGANDLEIVDYSEKAIAVTGNTRPIAETLKALGGRFNARLSCGAGWIFSKKKESEVREALAL